MLEFIASAVSFLLAISFAAVWGAHIYETAVLYPVWAAAPPKSLAEWLATPYAMRLTPFFQKLVPGLYTTATVALIIAIVMGLRMRLALAIAGVCGLLHLTMIILIFMPTNLKLGLSPGGAGISSLDPQTVTVLLQRWGRWNLVRLCVETTGLVAALLAFKAS